MRYLAKYNFLILLVIVMCGACVENVDFDQADAIEFTPEVELNLIYFNLNATDFFDQETQTSRLVVRDTTALDFLGGSAISESIQQIDFTFNFTNSFPRTFQVDFEFSRLNGEVTYTTSTMVVAGSLNNPVTSIFEESVSGIDVQNLTQAGQVVVTVTLPSANASLQGNLNLTSKAIYYVTY